jgi:target of EGR1 protein 1
MKQPTLSVILHNGMLDLMFLYHHFFNVLPEDVNQFVADASLMFPAGIYDTKYICEYMVKEKASFLSYIYRK